MPEGTSYGRQLTRLAERYRDEPAVILVTPDGRETTITWTELERRAIQVSQLFDERGVGEESLVAIALPNSIEHILATFGAWKAGASVLPLRYDLPPWERERLLTLASPSVVVTDWDDDASGRFVSTRELAGSTTRPATPLPDRVPKWSHVIASSGSTGQPKLIARPAPGVVADDVEFSVVVGDAERQVQLGASPLYHTNGWQGGAGGLLDGHRSVLMERFDAALAVDLIERHRVTITIMVPTMLLRIARLPGVTERDFSSLNRVVYGGASIPDWVARAWFELISPERFLFSYGSSEGLGLVLTTGDEWLKHPGTTGRPATCDLKILDTDGREVPTGTVGEIFVRPHTPDPTFLYLGAEMPAPTPDGFSTIGDLGWVDDDGFLYIADRRQDMIVSGGANVFPAEVEAALSEHPGIADQVVIGLPDDEWGQRVHAIVEPADPSAPLDLDALRAFCKERLASYKVPKSFETIATLPRSPAGKINRGLLVDERAPKP